MASYMYLRFYQTSISQLQGALAEWLTRGPAIEQPSPFLREREFESHRRRSNLFLNFVPLGQVCVIRDEWSCAQYRQTTWQQLWVTQLLPQLVLTYSRQQYVMENM